MPIEVAKTISVNARNTLVRNRDALQTRHGIQIFFPRNRVRGDTQDMVLKGGPNAIARAERDIDTILVAWYDEYTAFKQRQAHRKERRRIQHQETNQFPSVAESIPSKPRHTEHSLAKNAFAVLDGMEHDVPEPTIAPVPVTKPKEPTLTGWAAMAAKPAPKPKELPKAKMPSKFTFGTVGSGAAFTYPETLPEPEHFDWAEEVDTQFSPSPSPTGDGWDTW